MYTHCQDASPDHGFWRDELPNTPLQCWVSARRDIVLLSTGHLKFGLVLWNKKRHFNQGKRVRTTTPAGEWQIAQQK